jgi:hypothetical protein
MDIIHIVNGIKVYTPIAMSRLYDKRTCIKICRRVSQTEKVRLGRTRGAASAIVAAQWLEAK